MGYCSFSSLGSNRHGIGARVRQSLACVQGRAAAAHDTTLRYGLARMRHGVQRARHGFVPWQDFCVAIGGSDTAQPRETRRCNTTPSAQ